MGLNIKHGGFSRLSAAVSSGESTAWAKGRLLTINTDGQIAVSSGAAGALVGVALEDRVLSTSVGPTTTATVVGAPSGEQRSMVLDFAVIETTELQSGLTFAAGDILYPSTTGKVTTSGNSTGPNCPKIGIALGYGHAGDVARPLSMTFDVQY